MANDTRRLRDGLYHKTEQRLWVAVIERAYLDLFGEPQRDEDRYNSRNAFIWLFSDAFKEERENRFDLAGISQESMNREIVVVMNALITRNTE